MAYLRSKLFKNLNGINYVYVHPFAIERWHNKCSHEIAIIKENINLVFIKRINSYL
jgi:hypothetical protein